MELRVDVGRHSALTVVAEQHRSVVVFITIGRVLRYAVDQADAIRRLDRAVVRIVVFTLDWTAITQASRAFHSRRGMARGRS